MKNLILLFLYLWTIVGIASGQVVEGKEFNKKGYQAWVTLEDSRVIHGLLWNVDSVKIQIKSDQIKGWKDPDSSAKIFEIPVERIQSIKTKKIRAVLKGYGWGAIIGNSFGAMVAVASDDDMSILYVPLFGMIGSVAGIIAGSLPDKKFGIETNQEKMNQALLDLDKRSFWRAKEVSF